MKQIKIYINEKLHVTKKSFYTCQPKTKEELQKIIIERIKDDGNECDLNDIDVSKITDMSWLFNGNTHLNSGNNIFKNFNGDISLWNVSNVKNMSGMFNFCNQFNCDISSWNVSHVTDMSLMFNGCYKFNCDISHWNVSNVEDMRNAFVCCPTKPEWYNE